MTPGEALTTVIRPAHAELATLLGLPLATAGADCLSLAVAVQESGLRTRLQDGGGPGRSFWQIEAGLDALSHQPRRHMLAVAVHPTGRLLADRVMQDLGSGQERVSVPISVLHAALGDPAMDRLACKIARLLLWLDPHPLPAVGDEEGGWACYLRCWAPGKPDRARWTDSYAAALAAVQGAAT